MATRTRSAAAAPAAAGTGKNYVTPRGYERLRDELRDLLGGERPELVRTIAWAASNGDRSENGDYIYGKKRLREIDRRIHYLTRQLKTAEIVDPARQAGNDRIFFGATVVYLDAAGARHTVTIVGNDETDTRRGQVSWRSPIARALMRHRAGDATVLATPEGEEALEIVEVRYEPMT